jgi:hypothetical protein
LSRAVNQMGMRNAPKGGFSVDPVRLADGRRLCSGARQRHDEVEECPHLGGRVMLTRNAVPKQHSLCIIHDKRS